MQPANGKTSGVETPAQVREKLLEMGIAELCGQLLVGGFEGKAVPESVLRRVGDGLLAGTIVFRRNLEDRAQIVAMNREVIAASPAETPPFLALDQEGGRVVRLPPPFFQPPPMRVLGGIDDLELTRAVAEQMARELRLAGFNLNFSPVLDVDSNPDNPVIGDRAFARDPRNVMRHGVAMIQGFQNQHVLACAKHFPGHGDTSLDSHLALPRVEHPRERLDQIELPPFRAASGAGVASMMTAHVVYDGLDEGVPATLSRAICGSLLRREIAFDGVLFSDDLEMGALAGFGSIGELACKSIAAGCDVLLICKTEALQVEAHEALVRRAESDERFRARCQEAATRSLRLRALCPPLAADDVADAEEVRNVHARGHAVRERILIHAEALLKRVEEANTNIADDPTEPG